ncbi:MAG: RNHCP domain-containing protein [Patescibacteria group bacterium]
MKKFQRKIENFTCEHCGEKVIGNGYTNHCPNCLHSKHVDINPGDRMSNCQSLMRPISIESKNGNYILVHQCVKCNYQKKNKVAQNDNFDKIIEISRKGADTI